VDPLLLGALAVLVLNRPSSQVGASGVTIFNRERASGVHPDLQALLDAWLQEGTFDISIGGGGGFPNGGLRTQGDVDTAAAAGLSNATELSQTAHGRGGAIDVWPAGFNPFRSFDEQPGMQDLMRSFGQWAQSKGFVWGGTFGGFYSSSARVTGDWPHVEMRNWRSLPFPPPDYGAYA
jgi:hypothetical protein